MPLAVAAVAAFWIGHRLPARYRASALLGVEWQSADDALLRQRGIDVAERRAAAVRQSVTERALVERAWREASAVAQRDATGGAAGGRPFELRVSPVASSSFEIEVVHGDGGTAASLANTIARLLAEPAGPAGEAGASRAALEGRLAEARRTLAEKADALARLAPSAAPPASDEAEPATSDDPALDEGRVVAASLAAAHARAERLRLELRAEGASDAGAPAELQRMRDELAGLRKRYTEQHPDVEKLRLQIRRLEASLGSTSVPAPASAQQQLAATEAEIAQLLERQRELEASGSRPAEPRRERAVAEHGRAQRAYEDLLAEWQRAQAPAAPRRHPLITRFELLRPATIPQASETPRTWLVAIVGAFLGLLAGLTAAVVAEVRDRRLRGPEDLEHILPVPLLATLPEVRTRDR